LWVAVSSRAQAASEKESLPAQERDERAVCLERGWDVAEVLTVPGFSRDYIDIHKCADEMAAQGIVAFKRLIDLWQRRAFDFLICRDGERFARTQTLFSYIVETTIKEIGARIYSLADGLIDENNYRLWIAMGGYKAASDIDRLVRARKKAMAAKAAKGLPTSSRVLLSHRVERDEKHRAVRLVVDESKRSLFDDLYKLILEHVPWNLMDAELYRRFGQTNPRTGQPFASGMLYKLVYSPTFWGNSGQFHGNLHGAWAYDPTCPPPEGVVLHYGTHPPVWTGSQAEAIKAELRRREEIVRGRRRGEVYRFSGLVICDECRFHLSFHGKKRKKDGSYLEAYQCNSQLKRWRESRHCPQRRHVSARVIFEYLNALLADLLAHSDDVENYFFRLPQQEQQAVADQVRKLEKAIAGLDERLRYLIDAQTDPALSQAARGAYADRIRAVDAEMEARRAELEQLQRQMESPSVLSQRRVALDEIATLGLAAFWAQDRTTINASLHRLFGRYRLRARDGQIVGLAKTTLPNLRRRSP
jgi:hypothetical protein